MMYVTGDTHMDWRDRLCDENFPEGKKLKKSDYVVICGDFGLWSDTQKVHLLLDWLENKEFTTLWVDGNHENYDLLNTYNVSEWKGGKVQFIRPSVIHLMRGQVFTIDNRTIFTFGGARSTDIRDGILEQTDEDFYEKYRKLYLNPFSLFRVNHLSWWKEEMPNSEEYAEGLANLKRVDNKVDYIFTHAPSTSLLNYTCYMGVGEPDELTGYLDKLHENVEYKHWYFGHMHVNKDIPKLNATCLYEGINKIY